VVDSMVDVYLIDYALEYYTLVHYLHHLYPLISSYF
jgi:hypothetical protein